MKKYNSEDYYSVINKNTGVKIVDCAQRDKKYAGVICGHIHSGNIRNFGKITYMCCGDWCDTCSAIVEKNGVYSLEKY